MYCIVLKPLLLLLISLATFFNLIWGKSSHLLRSLLCSLFYRLKIYALAAFLCAVAQNVSAMRTVATITTTMAAVAQSSSTSGVPAATGSLALALATGASFCVWLVAVLALCSPITI